MVAGMRRDPLARPGHYKLMRAGEPQRAGTKDGPGLLAMGHVAPQKEAPNGSARTSGRH
jgi:hypothetical protein